MTKHVAHLLQGRQGKDHAVRASTGLALQVLDYFADQTRSSFDVEVERDGIFSWIRVIPVREQFYHDNKHEGVVRIDSAYGIFLDDDLQTTDHMVSISGHIDLNGAIHAGKVTMWPCQSIEEFFRREIA